MDETEREREKSLKGKVSSLFFSLYECFVYLVTASASLYVRTMGNLYNSRNLS